ncbi:MAG TPA: serine/threonine-protein kinase [bacterium]|nr:serine/threonine-protein kinase [bacterium]
MIGKWVGSYEVKGLIGEGESSIVYRAVQPSLGRPVAIKKLKLFQTSDPSVRERFREEALAQSKLSHPHIVVLYDFVRQYDSYFIIMEMLKRRTLREVISDDGRVASDRLIPTFCQILDAIGVAHRLGVLHGDIRPSNVFVCEDGSLKVADFGASRVIGVSAMLPGSSIPGRVRYLSPEEIRRQAQDERSDIYSLGALLFEMATGQPPFSGTSAFEIMERHVKEAVPSPRSIVGQVPQVIEDAILRALQKSPDKRFQTVKEFEAHITGDTIYMEVTRLNKRAFSLYNETQYRSAIAIWQEVLKLDPSNAKAQGGITRAHSHLGEPEGQGLFEAALEVPRAKPSGEGARKESSRMGRHNRTLRGAISVLVRAIKSPRSLQREPLLMFLLILMLGVVFLSGHLILLLSSPERAEGIKLAVSRQGDLLERGINAPSSGLGPRNVHSDRQVLAQDLAAEGKALCNKGEWRRALVSFEKASELAEGTIPGLVEDYSACCVQLGRDRVREDPDTALEFLRKAIRINPNSFEAFLEAGRICSRRHEYQRAISNYKKALSINPDLPLAHFNLGHAYLSMKRYSQAVAEFKAVIGSGSSLMCDAYINLGVTYHKMGRLKQAVKVFSEGLRACPKSKNLKLKQDLVLRQLRDASRKQQR